jgi:di/tricarboxylate transporter
VTPQIALSLFILAMAIMFFVTEWLPMEVVALLVLGTVAITGLVNPTEALSGFSSPAVVTVWAVFILSGGLTRTGVASIIGRNILRLAGKREFFIVTVVMLSAGIMSAFMNNVAVAALMLPVVMDISRQTGHPASRLLMPLAYGSLLGGLTTLIGTPPNILISEALRDNGLTPFKFFDYTPVGAAVMVAGIIFMVLIGRYLLPSRDVTRESSTTGQLSLRERYELSERMFLMRIPANSVLVGKKLRESRLGSALGLHVMGIIRNSRTEVAPEPSTILFSGDRLIVEGRPDQMDELSHWRKLEVEQRSAQLEKLFSPNTAVAEVRLSAGSNLIGKTLNEAGFHDRFGVNILVIRRGDTLRRSDLQDEHLEADDTLLLQGIGDRLESIEKVDDFKSFRLVSVDDLEKIYRLHERLMIVRILEGSTLVGKSLQESRLGDALGMRVLSFFRTDETMVMPEAGELLSVGDRLMMLGKLDDLFILQGLEQLEIEQEVLPDINELESARVGLVEGMLSPRTTLAGKTLRQIHFREKYGLSVVAIWRAGKILRTNIRDIALRFGDALLLYGRRDKLGMLGLEPDFLVLTESAQETPHFGKAKVSTLIMLAVLLPVIMGLVPIFISAVIGAAFMVLFRCLTMEEAYRDIEWKAVFLIAGMLPLGNALDQTGAAKFLAEGVVSIIGPFGPKAVLSGLIVLTFIATCFIPTAALVVIMAPIAISTSVNMGISQYALMMAVAMAASASFMTPISHPANILVMGPGGYRFIDYLKIGLPLSLVVLLVLVFVLPYFWPLVG